MQKRILSLCDYTGIWSLPYRDAGFDVVQVDLRNGVDVRLIEYPGDVFGIIAQPPCTHFASSGARWWSDKGDSALLDALSVVDACLRLVAVCRPKFWVLENPVGRLSRYIGKPVTTYQPCDYAGYSDRPGSEAYTKRTCLWGAFVMPEPYPVPPVLGSVMHRLPPSSDRADLRSVTPSGFANAFYLSNS